MHYRYVGTAIALVLLALLTLWPTKAPTHAQTNPPLIIEPGRPNPAQDRRPGDPVIAPGEDVFTVQVRVMGGDCPTVVRTSPVDVVLVIDISDSMNESAGTSGVSRIEAVRQAGSEFVRRFNLTEDQSSDQVGLVTFASGAQVISRSAADQPYEVDTALSRSVPDLQASLRQFTQTAGGTQMSGGLELARAILDGRSRNLPGGSAAVVVVLTDADRVEDLSDSLREADLLRDQLQARIVTIAFGEAVDQDFIEQLADPGDAFAAVSPEELNAVYTQIATLIQPSVSAEDISVTYTVATTSYELRPDTINPPPLSVNGNIITWPTLSSLDRGEDIEYTFEVRAIQPGGASVGDVSATFRPCQEPDPQTISAPGPVVQALLPTATPTPTSTPTPTVTPTPTITPTATQPAFTTETMNNTPSNLPGITGALCIAGWWDLIPWLGALLALLLALWFIRRSLRKLRENVDPNWRDWLCFLLRAGLALYCVFLVFLFLQPVKESVCEIPESVYFWRLDGSSSGIFVTNNNTTEPAQVTQMQQGGCVGCHVVGAQADTIAAIAAPPVPGSMVAITLDGEPIAMPGLDAVYMAIAPDGQQLAVTSGSADLYVVPLGAGSAGTPRQITSATDSSFGALMPAWTADSQQIAYVRVPRNQIQGGIVAHYSSEIYLVDAAGVQPPQPLVFSDRTGGVTGLNYYPSFSPDGRWLAFTRHQNSSGNTYASPDADVWLLDLRKLASNPQAVSIAANAPNASDSWASWNQDGSVLAFNTTRFDASYDIVLTNVDANGSTTAPMLLSGASQPGVFEHLPAWGPPPERISLFESWQNLIVPWLIPIFLIWLGLVLLCTWLKPKVKREDTADDPTLPVYQPLQPLTSKPLPVWKGIDSLWTPQPALVIGVGAAGWHTLAQLKKTLTDAGLGTPSDKVRLLCIIAGDDKSYRNDETFSGIPLEEHEMLRWGDSLKSLIDGARGDDALKNWVNSRYLEQYAEAAFNPKNGFENTRVLGRLALINNLRGVSRNTGKLVWEELNSASQSVRDERTLNVILVSDLSDDVGSGAVFDLAYLVKRLLEESALDLETVRLIGHLLTERATRGMNINATQRPVNTAAALRELERFQLVAGAPFPISYAAQASQPTVLDGEVRRKLFDELYLHDGERSPGPLTSIPATQGVYPAVADCIALWLDEAAREGDLYQWRAQTRNNTNAAQIAEQRVMVGGMGIFQFRLPFADLLEEITVRYSRDVLQRLLMADSDDPPVFNPRLARENIVANSAGDVPKLAGAFLRGELGTPNLHEQWRRLWLGLLNNDDAAVRKTLNRLRVDTDNDSMHYASWLRQALSVILNGRAENAAVDIIVKRGAKISLAYAFLDYLSQEGRGLMDRFASQLENMGADASIPEQLRTFALIGRAIRDDLNVTARALGLETADNSLYARLAKRAGSIQERMGSLNELRTRQYIFNDGDGRALSDLWYNQYLSSHVREALNQLTWAVSDAQPMPVLRLRLPRLEAKDKTIQGEREVVFNLDNIQVFEDALLEIGRYFAQEVRTQENLSNVLRGNQLHPDNIDRTTDDLMRESGVLLGIGGGGDAGARMTEAVIFSASTQLEHGDNLRTRLLNRVRTSNDLKRLETGDPFTLTVARTTDTLPPQVIPSLVADFRRYDDEVYRLGGGQTASVFDAETTAVEYERRLGEIAEQPRRFNPLVVTTLAKRQQAETYLLSVVAREWSFNRNDGLRINTQETGSLALIPSAELRNLSFCVLLEGMLRFRDQVDEATARATYERYINDERIMRLLDDWEQASGESWLEDFADTCGENLVNDLISITRLLIRRILENA